MDIPVVQENATATDEERERVWEVQSELQKSQEALELCRERLHECYPSEWAHWMCAVAMLEREVARHEGRVNLR